MEPEQSGRVVYASKNARKYDPAQLALIEDDDRLLRAARMLNGVEFNYGFYGGRLYIAALQWGRRDWEEASRWASELGGYLATLTTQEENTFVFDLIGSDQRFWQRNDEYRSFYGPGFGFKQHDNAAEPSGGWFWINNEPTKWKNWMRDEPSNSRGDEHWAGFHHYFESRGAMRFDRIKPTWGDFSNDQGAYRGFVIEFE